MGTSYNGWLVAFGFFIVVPTVLGCLAMVITDFTTEQWYGTAGLIVSGAVLRWTVQHAVD